MRTCTSPICAGSRVNSGSIVLGAGATVTKSTQSPGMSTRGSRSTTLVHLGDDDAVPEGGRLDDRRRVLGVRAGVEVAVAIGRERGDERHPRREVHEVAGVELEVGVDGADLDPPARRRAARAACPAARRRRSPTRRAMPRSKSSTCSGSASTERTRCRSWTRAGSTRASARARKSACFWLSPSRQTRSPGSRIASRSGVTSAGSTQRPPPPARARSRRARRPRRAVSQARVTRPSARGRAAAASRPPRVRRRPAPRAPPAAP